MAVKELKSMNRAPFSLDKTVDLKWAPDRLFGLRDISLLLPQELVPVFLGDELKEATSADFEKEWSQTMYRGNL